MSLPAVVWARGQSLPSSQKSVLMALASHKGKRKHCWPKTSTLIRETGLSRSTVFRALRGLEEHRLIFRQKRYRQDGSIAGNEYVLALGTQCQGDTTPCHDDTTPRVTVTPPSVKVTPHEIETRKDTGKDKEGAVAQPSNVIDFQDSKMNKRKMQEILADLDKDRPETEAEAVLMWQRSGKGVSPTGLMLLWKKLHQAHDLGFVALPNAAILGNLREVGLVLGDRAKDGMCAALADWKGFTAFCEKYGDAFDSPLRPTLRYWITHSALSVEFVAHTESLDDGWKDTLDVWE